MYYYNHFNNLIQFKVAFYAPMHVGDEPAQRRHCGLMEGGAKHFCTLCTYAHEDKSYDPNKHEMRDYQAIYSLWNQYDSLSSKKNKDAITMFNEFKSMSVSHMKSPFADAPLGVNNNVFKGKSAVS